MHAAQLVTSLKKKDSRAVVRGCGGDLMKSAGADLLLHYKDMAYMGITEVLAHLGKLMRNMRLCKSDMLKFKPDAVVLVDYPGFNLKMAKFAKNHGFKVFYYISPQVWAWKEKRVRLIEKYVDKMFVILPFEKDFYSKYDVDVEYVGHPLVSQMKSLPAVEKRKFVAYNHLNRDKEIIALLPGSRIQEVDRMMDVMLDTAPKLKKYQFVVAIAPNISAKPYRKRMAKRGVKFVKGQTRQLLQIASAAVVASGTATLETALLSVPEVVCYRTSNLTYKIFKKLVKVKHISLPNLILGREVVKELIQDDLTANNIAKELRVMLDNAGRQRQMLEDYDELSLVLAADNPSQKVAEGVWAALGR